MDANECLLNRRSIRKYKTEQIKETELEAVLNAGVYAPTAMGTQSPLIVVVQDKNLISRMSKLNGEIWGSDIDPFYGAPTAIVVFGDSTVKNCVQDATLVMGNLMNAAYANGLGSCWINRTKESFELPEGLELKKELGVDDKYVGVGTCILGYPDSDHPVPKARKQGYIIRK